MSISEREMFLKEHPEVESMITSPSIHSGRGLKKPDSGFRDILKEIKKKHSGGFSRSTINDF